MITNKAQVARRFHRRESAKIARWVKYTYRLFFTDGTSKYMSRFIAQCEGGTNKDTADYIVRDFREYFKHDPEVKSMKLISVDGERFNIMVEAH